MRATEKALAIGIGILEVYYYIGFITFLYKSGIC